MVQVHLLEVDGADTTRTDKIVYKVPDIVWRTLERADLPSPDDFDNPPWIRSMRI
jgi:hypothetical protein